MEKSEVFFTNLRTNPKQNLLDKVERLIKKAGIETIDFKDKYVAVKIHFGEPGNLAYIRPNYAARVVSFIQQLGGKVYMTDCNTLYSGGRSNAVDHLHSAMTNGFNPIAVPCPVIIADGLRGTEQREIAINKECCATALIGSGVADADIIISMNHFKGHEMAGFGGALKNLGMGAASVAGKLFLHASSQPRVEPENCIGCNICVKNCAHNAIHLVDRKAVIDYDTCVGCGQCVALCASHGVVVNDKDSSILMNKKIAEYTYAILDGKPNFHISFIMNVSPECDCWNHNDAAIIPDLGIVASFDPVALDKACVDLVTQAPALTNNRLTESCCHHTSHVYKSTEGKDKFRMIHPDTDWKSGLVHAEKLGLGSLDYELITL